MNTASPTDELVQRNKISVYFLAAPEEEDECQAIRKYLVPAIRNSKVPVEILSDFDIPAGEDKERYKQKLFEADIVLALISSDYISDDETYERTQKVIARYNKNETFLVPILVRNCMWKHTPFVKLSLLPKNLQPLNNKEFWKNDDDAFMAVVEDIYDAIDEFGREESVHPEPTPEFKNIVDLKSKLEPPVAEQIKIDEQPEQLINGVEVEVSEESQVEELTPIIEPEKIVASTTQPIVAGDFDNTDNSQKKKQKTVTKIEVDWRKHYYRKVTWKRMLAFILDHLVMIPVSLIILLFTMIIFFLFKDESVPDLSDNEYIFVFVFTFCSYFIINAKMESSKWRGTLGKRLLKLQITDRKGDPITFIRALGRNLLRTIVGYSYVFIIPFIIQWFVFRKTKKLFHDQLSSTVIGERLNK
jgi:uncharacterized RDD family membrane protein YckC